MEWSWQRAVVVAIALLSSVVMYHTISAQEYAKSLSRLSNLSLPFNRVCERPKYTVRILSYDPLIMHLENFITPSERRHLQKIGAPRFERSTVGPADDANRISPLRTSSTAMLPRRDPTVKCITERVSEFQGYEPVQNIEQLQLTSYATGQEYKPHFDWFRRANITRNRVTTFFGILDADCESCGTEFPAIPAGWASVDERWCRIVDCAADTLKVLPVAGNALFWRNLHSNCSGDKRMLHAGSPLSRGTKVGLNIWTLRDVA